MHPQCQSADQLRIPKAILVASGGDILRPLASKNTRENLKNGI